MITITEDYVIFEVAKLLKEKGFIEDCLVYYNKVGDLVEETYKFNWNFQTIDYSAPTLQMAIKYLRKKYKLCIVSIPVVTDDDGDGGCLWNYVISRKLIPLYESESLYESPKIALNNAIKYCLKKLI